MDPNKRLQVRFYRSATGNESVRVWLLDLTEDRQQRSEDRGVRMAVGHALVSPDSRRLMGSQMLGLTGSRNIARVLFCTTSDHLVLLHGFVKKTQQTPNDDIDLALSRMRELSHE